MPTTGNFFAAHNEKVMSEGSGTSTVPPAASPTPSGASRAAELARRYAPSAPAAAPAATHTPASAPTPAPATAPAPAAVPAVIPVRAPLAIPSGPHTLTMPPDDGELSHPFPGAEAVVINDNGTIISKDSEIPVPLDQQYIILEVLTHWVRWEENKVAARIRYEDIEAHTHPDWDHFPHRGLLDPPPPPRNSNEKDCWSQTRYVRLLAYGGKYDGSEFSFSTAAFHSGRQIRTIVDLTARQQLTHPGVLPVVRLQTYSRTPKTAGFRKFWVLAYTVVGWVKPDGSLLGLREEIDDAVA